jgi:integral membrane sensor domain MASE1
LQAPPTWAPIAAGVFGVLTLVGKMVRPGGFLHSLFGGTAVIVPESQAGVGTVTPEQVASK